MFLGNPHSSAHLSFMVIVGICCHSVMVVLAVLDFSLTAPECTSPASGCLLILITCDSALKLLSDVPSCQVVCVFEPAFQPFPSVPDSLFFLTPSLSNPPQTCLLFVLTLIYILTLSQPDPLQIRIFPRLFLCTERSLSLDPFGPPDFGLHIPLFLPNCGLTNPLSKPPEDTRSLIPGNSPSTRVLTPLWIFFPEEISEDLDSEPTLLLVGGIHCSITVVFNLF